MGEIASLIPIIQGTSSLAGGYAQYSASKGEGAYLRQVGNANAIMAEAQAQDAKRIAEVEAGRRMQQGVADASSHRAKMGASGVDVNTGSAAATQEQIIRAAATDAATIRKNAAAQAWGYGVEAANQRARGRMGYIGARNEGMQSLISGGMQFARYGLEAYKGLPKVPDAFNYGDQEDFKKTKRDWEDLD